MDHLRSIDAAVRLGSFTAAADALHLTQSAVSKQIKALEDLIGTPVFIRGSRTLELTDAGRILSKGVAGVLRDLGHCLQDVVGAPRACIAITAPPAFASLWLAPRLPRYRAMVSDVDIRLDASEAPVPLDRAGMDLAIRMSTPEAASGDWVPLFTERLILVAAPACARQIRCMGDLLNAPLLEFDHRSARLPGMSWAHWFDAAGVTPGPTQARHRFTQYEHLLKAAQEGLGVAVGRLPLVADAIGSGRLQHVLPELGMDGACHYLVVSASAQQRPEVQVLTQWLRSSLTMNAHAHLDTIVQGLVSAHRRGQPWTLDTPPPDLSLADAYAIQAGVAQALGWFPDRPRAWKVGGTTEITAAPLPSVLSSPATWDMGDQADILIEAELAFRLARTPQGPDDVLASLGDACVSIEVIGTRLAQGLDAPPHWKLADQGVHAGLIVGAPVSYGTCAGFTEQDWRQQGCRVRVNGQVVQETRGSHPAGSPLTTLPWLVDHAATHTGGLRAGDLVTTGAWIALRVRPGDRVDVDFDGFGTACLQLST